MIQRWTFKIRELYIPIKLLYHPLIVLSWHLFLKVTRITYSRLEMNNSAMKYEQT